MKKWMKVFLLVATILAVALMPWHYVVYSQPKVAPPINPHDDYPTIWKNAPALSMNDSWHKPNRDCSSWVSWKLWENYGIDSSNFWGNAYDWLAIAKHFNIPINNIPAKGAVVEMLPGEKGAGPTGHVMWVEAIQPYGNVKVSEYNGDNKYAFDEHTIDGSMFTYIHFEQSSLKKFTKLN